MAAASNYVNITLRLITIFPSAMVGPTAADSLWIHHQHLKISHFALVVFVLERGQDSRLWRFKGCNIWILQSSWRRKRIQTGNHMQKQWQSNKKPSVQEKKGEKIAWNIHFHMFIYKNVQFHKSLLKCVF